jgi:hypothetical protein
MPFRSFFPTTHLRVSAFSPRLAWADWSMRSELRTLDVLERRMQLAIERGDRIGIEGLRRQFAAMPDSPESIVLMDAEEAA